MSDEQLQQLVKLKLVNNHSDKIAYQKIEHLSQFDLIVHIMEQSKVINRYEQFYNGSKWLKEKKDYKERIRVLELTSAMNNDEKVKHIREEHKKQIKHLKKMIKKLSKQLKEVQK